MTIWSQFQHLGIFHFQRLGHEHDCLVKQSGQIFADHCELAKRAHNCLLKGSIEKNFFCLFALFDALFERSGHGIKRARHVAQFAFLVG